MTTTNYKGYNISISMNLIPSRITRMWLISMMFLVAGSM